MLNRFEKFTLYGMALTVIIGFIGVYNTQKNIRTEIEDKRNFYEYEIEQKMRLEAIHSALDIMDTMVTEYCLQKPIKVNMKEARSVLNKLYFTDKTGKLIAEFTAVLKHNNLNILPHYRNFRIEAREQMGYKHPIELPYAINKYGVTVVEVSYNTNKPEHFKEQKTLPFSIRFGRR